MTERRLAWTLVTPALASILLVALFPLGWTVWESLHQHDLRMPWLGRPFVGADNYVAIAHDARFWSALGHTAFFAVVTSPANAGIVKPSARAKASVERSVLMPITPSHG